MITAQQIKETKTYSELSNIRKQLATKYNNVKAIDNGFNVSKHKGFEQWSSESNACWQNKEIIKELLDAEQVSGN